MFIIYSGSAPIEVRALCLPSQVRKCKASNSLGTCCEPEAEEAWCLCWSNSMNCSADILMVPEDYLQLQSLLNI